MRINCTTSIVQQLTDIYRELQGDTRVSHKCNIVEFNFGTYLIIIQTFKLVCTHNTWVKHNIIPVWPNTPIDKNESKYQLSIESPFSAFVPLRTLDWTWGNNEILYDISIYGRTDIGPRDAGIMKILDFIRQRSLVEWKKK